MDPSEKWAHKWKKIEEARKILKLPIKTTRKEIIEHYKDLVKKTHPDLGGDEEQIKKINEAYEILMEYCNNYIISLAPNENIFDPEEFWFKHFGEDPLWAKKK